MSETTVVIKEVKALKSGTSGKGEWNLYGVLGGNDEIIATTFDATLFQSAKQFEGSMALVEFTEDAKGKKLTAIKPAPSHAGPPPSNGSTPPLGTGEYVKGQTAPADAVRMARSTAWKVIGPDVFKVVLSAYSAEQPNHQMTVQNVLDLAARVARYITNNITDDESIPF